mmetsp:Transcript_21714/g.42667  ORF Transcript_21714/g.42667 Transcript_21714/m.42667 type:complete len:201 (-) Transcript_21714:667-1269(-)
MQTLTLLNTMRIEGMEKEREKREKKRKRNAKRDRKIEAKAQCVSLSQPSVTAIEITPVMMKLAKVRISVATDVRAIGTVAEDHPMAVRTKMKNAVTGRVTVANLQRETMTTLPRIARSIKGISPRYLKKSLLTETNIVVKAIGLLLHHHPLRLHPKKNWTRWRSCARNSETRVNMDIPAAKVKLFRKVQCLHLSSAERNI